MAIGLTGSARFVSADDIKGRIGYSIALVSPTGTYAYLPGAWGVLHVHLVNPEDEPAELLTATYFDGNPTLQFGRRVWLPPKSRMKTWHPILLPAQASDGGRRFDFHTLVMHAEKGREVLIRSDTGYLQLDGTLKTVEDRPVTGLLDNIIPDRPEEESSAFDLVMAGRQSQQLRRHIANLSGEGAPPGEESLQALDQLVIASDRVLQDAAGIDTIRRWLFGGGRLWVMLDRTGPEFLERLLGDEYKAEVVDRVGLNSVTVETRLASQGVNVHKAEFEKPVDFVRTIVEGVEVVSTIDGWPAAWWKTCGDGRMLVTTLGPRGWMQLREPPIPPGLQPGLPRAQPRVEKPEESAVIGGVREQPGKFVPTEPMTALATAFFEKRAEPRIPAPLFESQVQEFVGYSIPSRGLVISLLVGFGGLIAATGAWLWRIGRLEWLGAIGPVAAIGIAVTLVLFGRQQRDAVPPSVASVEIVQVVPGTDDVRVEGVAGIYSSDSGEAEISAVRGGWFVPELTGTEGQTRRMVWTDLETWRWENLPQLAGLRSARFQEAHSLSERIEAQATFGAAGLSGKLSVDPDRKPADPIVATRYGRMGVTLNPDGSFTALENQVFSDDQFLAAGILSDEQNRRRLVLEKLLTDPNRREYPDVPHLFFWTDPWDLGFRLGADKREFGAALVAVPLQLERPAPGTEVGLPSPFLPFRAVHGPDGIAPSGLFDHRKREWAEKADPSTSWFRIQVPEVLLPAELLGGKISVKVSGPVGKLEICGLRENSPVSIKTWMDPVGTLTLDLAETELFKIGADGGLLIRMGGGDPDRPELTRPEKDFSGKANYWKIEDMDVELRVRTLASPESAAASAPGP